MSRHVRAIVKADEAEARGDALGALTITRGLPTGPDGRPFWRPWRVMRLEQLALLKPILPRWVTSRWVLEQVLQSLQSERRPAVIEALRIATELGGGEANLPGVDSLDAQCKVMDHDWAYRQLVLYDFGGLEHFVRQIATPDLLAGANDLVGWAKAAMSGYQLAGATSRGLLWRDLADRSLKATANIGAAAEMSRGEYVIGRMVEADFGSMFETAPLRVPEGVAELVAKNPSAWVDHLRRELAVSPDSIQLGGRDFSIVTDVPVRRMLGFVLGVPPVDLPSDLEAGDFAEQVLSRIRERLHRQSDQSDEPGPDDSWPCLGAALLDPDLFVYLMTAASEDDAHYFELAGACLAEPAAALCQILAARHLTA